MIDIIFFLLATFVMVSLSMVKNQGLNVHLPVASSGSPQDRNDAVSLSVTESGEYSWNKENIALQELILRLHQFHVDTPEGRVFLNSDGQARFQIVVTLLDEVSKAGVTKVAIQTSPMP